MISTQGNKLGDLLPEDARPRVEEVISKDNNRFEAISDQIIQRAEKFRLSRQKSLEVGEEFFEKKKKILLSFSTFYIFYFLKNKIVLKIITSLLITRLKIAKYFNIK